MMLPDFVIQLGGWAWVIGGLILLGLEILAPGNVFVWFGVAAMITGGFALLTDFGWQVDSLLFVVLAIVLVIVGRRKAVMQALGYLAMENGIYAFGLAFAVEEPLLVEMGVLLDVFVAVFVMGIAIHHISREFDHIDTDRLSALKD